MVKQWQVMADDGHAAAMYSLGWCHERGVYAVKKSHTAAFIWYQRSAGGGDPDGTAVLGRCYIRGVGVIVDAKRGLCYLAKGAMHGSSIGCYLLGSYFARGVLGVSKDAKLATMWWRRLLALPVGAHDPQNEATASWRNEATAWLSNQAHD